MEKKVKQRQIAIRPATYERLEKIKQGSFDKTINILMDNVKMEEKTISVIKEEKPKKEETPEEPPVADSDETGFIEEFK